jgi:hypothetical protein
MPAIQPARLQQQAETLAGRFSDPPAYIRQLHDLLNFYADRTLRPGQSGKPNPLIAAYKVSPPVLRSFLKELLPLAAQDAQQALALVDALWAEPVLELRLLSSMLLGQTPLEHPEPVIQRIQDWVKPELEDALIQALLVNGLVRLRQENSPAIVSLVQSWLEQTNLFYQQLGLRTLLPIIQDPAYENLPVFFRLIHPFVQSAHRSLRPDLLDVLQALAQRSPQETAYFLRQTLALPDSPDTPWLIRQCLGSFPPAQQEMLKKAVRSV